MSMLRAYATDMQARAARIRGEHYATACDSVALVLENIDRQLAVLAERMPGPMAAALQAVREGRDGVEQFDAAVADGR